MKTLLLLPLLLLFTTLAGRAQELLGPLPVDGATRLVTYTAVVQTPGITQATLLDRARVWANRVSLPNKPPLAVSELGTDVVVVAGFQVVNPTFSVPPQQLYFVARVALREGRYQYRFEEFTLVTAGADGTKFDTAEMLFLQEAPPKASSNSGAARLRKAFDEAAGQAAATLHAALTTALTDGTGNW